MKNKYHSIERGCSLIEKTRIVEERKKDYFVCESHKLEICRCGWEHGWHFGVESKLLDNKQPI